MTTVSLSYATQQYPRQYDAPVMLSIFVGLFILRLLAAGVDSTISIGASEIATVLLISFLIFSFLINPRVSIPDGIILGGSVLFVVIVFLSHLNSDLSSLQGAVRLAAIFPLYALFLLYATQAAQNFKLLNRVYTFLMFFIAIGFLLSVYQVFAAAGYVGRGRLTIVRAHGTAEHPVSYGLQVVLLLVLLDMTRRKLGLNATKLFWFIILMGGASLILTYARTAWVMAVVIIALMATQRFSLTARLLLFPVVAVFGAWFLVGTGRFDDLASLPEFLANTAFDSDHYDYRFVDNSVSWRIMAWNHMLGLISENPLFGYGPGSIREVSLSGTAAHNAFLEIASQTGFLGLIAFLIMLIGVSLKVRQISTTTPISAFSKAQTIRVSYLLFFAAMFGTSLIYQTVTLLLFMFLIAIALAPNHAAEPQRAATAIGTRPSRNL